MAKQPSAKQLAAKVASLRVRIKKQNEALTGLRKQHKEASTKLAEAKKADAAAKKASGGKKPAKKKKPKPKPAVAPPATTST
jgi:hypothetical protein